MMMLVEICALLLGLGVLVWDAVRGYRARCRKFRELFGCRLVRRGHRDYRRRVAVVDESLHAMAGLVHAAILDMERIRETCQFHAEFEEEIAVATQQVAAAREQFWMRFLVAEREGFPLRYLVQSRALDGAPVFTFHRRNDIQQSLAPGDTWSSDVIAYYPRFEEIGVSNTADIL